MIIWSTALYPNVKTCLPQTTLPPTFNQTAKTHHKTLKTQTTEVLEFKYVLCHVVHLECKSLMWCEYLSTHMSATLNNISLVEATVNFMEPPIDV